MWGNAAEVYARATGTNGGLVLTLDGGAFWPVERDLLGGGGSIRVTPAGAVWITTSFSALTCAGGCTDSANWSAGGPTLGASDVLAAVCLQGERPYFTASDVSSAVLFVPSAAPPWTWTRQVLGATTSSLVGGCAVAPDGTVYVALVGGVGRFAGAGDILLVPGGSSSQRWRDVLLVGRRGVLAGDSHALAGLRADGGWEFEAPPPSGPHLLALSATSDQEIYVYGFWDEVVRQNIGVSRGGGGWQFGALTRLDVYGAWAAGDNRSFVAGQQLNSVGGVVGGFILIGLR